jgi:hypothetical protein
MILRQLECVKNKLNFHMNGCLCDKVHNGNLQQTLGWFTLECSAHGPWDIIVPHFLDNTMAKHTGHGPRAFICSINLNGTIEETITGLKLFYLCTTNLDN